MSERLHPPAVHRETTSPDARTERRLWFGILGAPLAWTLHELVAVSVIGRRCAAAGALEGWQWAVIIGVSILAAVLAAAAAWSALRVHRERSGLRLTESEGWDRVEFMAIAGVIISLTLFATILLMGVMPAIVAPCMVTT